MHVACVDCVDAAEKETKVDKAQDIEKKFRFPNKEEPQLDESENENRETLQSKYKFLILRVKSFQRFTTFQETKPKPKTRGTFYGTPEI